MSASFHTYSTPAETTTAALGSPRWPGVDLGAMQGIDRTLAARCVR